MSLMDPHHDHDVVPRGTGSEVSSDDEDIEPELSDYFDFVEKTGFVDTHARLDDGTSLPLERYHAYMLQRKIHVDKVLIVSSVEESSQHRSSPGRSLADVLTAEPDARLRDSAEALAKKVLGVAAPLTLMIGAKTADDVRDAIGAKTAEAYLEAFRVQRESRAERESMVFHGANAVLSYAPLELGSESTKVFVETLIQDLNNQVLEDPEFMSATLRGVRRSLLVVGRRSSPPFGSSGAASVDLSGVGEVDHDLKEDNGAEDEARAIDTAGAALLCDENFRAGVQVLRGYQLVCQLAVRGPAQIAAAIELTNACTTEFVFEDMAHPELNSDRSTLWRKTTGASGVAVSGEEEASSWFELVTRLAKRRNVHCALSPGFLVGESEWSEARVAHLVKYCLRQFGPDRCVFGIGWPGVVDLGREQVDGRIVPPVGVPSSSSLEEVDSLPQRWLKLVTKALVESYSVQTGGLGDRPSSRESTWTLGVPQSWANTKLEPRIMLTIEKIFKKNADLKYIV